MKINKVAIVTGASKGIGYETARLLLEAGWKVAIVARGVKALEAAALMLDSPNVLAVPCDVSDRTSVDQLVATVQEEFGPIGALVNNAGVIDPVGSFATIDSDAWLRLQQINVGGVMNMSQAVLGDMVEAKSGVIVNLSSGAASNPVEGWSAYCTSKAAVDMFTRCLSAEVRDLGVRIHNFIPGVVNTDMLNGAQAQFDNAIARLDSSIKLPAELPAKCLAWIVDQGESHDLEPDLSIRDPYLRELVGLEERAQW